MHTLGYSECEYQFWASALCNRLVNRCLSQYTEVVTDNNSSYSFDLNGINGATTILVNLIDANGCTTSETINIEIYDDVDFTLTTSPTCENTAAEFVATGNATNIFGLMLYSCN